MARNACQKLRPNAATPSTPTKIVANSMLGETQVQNSCSGLTVPLVQRDELGTPRLDGDDPVPYPLPGRPRLRVHRRSQVYLVGNGHVSSGSP